jgi:hypothetical protein
MMKSNKGTIRKPQFYPIPAQNLRKAAMELHHKLKAKGTSQGGGDMFW